MQLLSVRRLTNATDCRRGALDPSGAQGRRLPALRGWIRPAWPTRMRTPLDQEASNVSELERGGQLWQLLRRGAANRSPDQVE
ncbi:unnamed protein product, partial [Amoebophrya sp. A120]|eukprot:GSA120T00001105001.1